MPNKNAWTRDQLLVAFGLYCQIPFGKLHKGNPEIIKFAKLIGRTPDALAMKLSNIASLDPVITGSGRHGLKSASSADKAMWDEMQSNWEQFSILSEKTLNSFKPIDQQETLLLDNVDENDDFSSDSKTIVAKRRVGQDIFRKYVLSAYESTCCVTGLAVPELLVAGHIVPWSKDSLNRLNPSNGLCLSRLHEKAFDEGYFTIQSDMTVCVSKAYACEEDQFYFDSIGKFHGHKITLPNKFVPRDEFLEYHRKEVFKT